MSNGGFLGPEATYSVAINSYGGSGGDGHLEVGAGIAVEKFHDRIISSTQREFRHYLISWIEESNFVDSDALNNWGVIPVYWHKLAREREVKFVFGDKVTINFVFLT